MAIPLIIGILFKLSTYYFNSNEMKLGYIHNSREEQTKVLQVLKMTSESAALDELGIGRLRDAFADRMFPVICTLQTHMTSFSLMPQLSRKAAERRYNRSSVLYADVCGPPPTMTYNLYWGTYANR